MLRKSPGGLPGSSLGGAGPSASDYLTLKPGLIAKVVFLERRVLELEKDTAATGEQHSRLRQENLQLVHR